MIVNETTSRCDIKTCGQEMPADRAVELLFPKQHIDVCLDCGERHNITRDENGNPAKYVGGELVPLSYDEIAGLL